MTTIQLKKTLMQQIADIEDISFLKALKTIIETKTKSDIIYLTNEQRAEIIESKKQVEKGLFAKQEDLQQEFEKWLSAN
jgi:glycerol-3-phosphate cytidylyltransferase-like family protein